MTSSKTFLYLKNGLSFAACGFGARVAAAGELVFTTSLTGYTESLTDPSYAGQILVFTNPLIGNYGFETHRMESARVQVSGVVITELAGRHSNPRTRLDLHSALARAGVPGIAGVDTRLLTTILREEGSQNGIVSPTSVPAARRRSLFRKIPDMEGLDLSDSVTVKKAVWHNPPRRCGLAVALLDFGVKRNIIRELLNLGVAIRQFPAAASSSDILASNPDGILLSNGPGDPAAMGASVERIRGLIGRLPIFGICLGHQLLALAAGLKTYKLKFGHRGTNHPVQDLRDGRIAITTQNHGFSVRTPHPRAARTRGLRITHLSLYDQTVEGLDLEGLRAFGVQYHPESAPGPRDSLHLFERFLAMCRKS